MESKSYNDREQDGPGPVGYLALVLAWAVPGLGHFILGERVRGIVFAVSLHALFAAGLLIGGIRAINPPDQAIWTYTQFLTGWPMVVANRVEKSWTQRSVTGAPSAAEDLEQLYVNKFRESTDAPAEQRQKVAREFIAEHPLIVYHPKVQDIGSVYCGIAGMLNLLVMFDVLLRVTGSVREDPAELRKKIADAKAAGTGGAAESGTGGVKG